MGPTCFTAQITRRNPGKVQRERLKTCQNPDGERRSLIRQRLKTATQGSRRSTECLTYASTVSRPDLRVAVGILGHFAENTTIYYNNIYTTIWRVSMSDYNIAGWSYRSKQRTKLRVTRRSNNLLFCMHTSKRAT